MPTFIVCRPLVVYFGVVMLMQARFLLAKLNPSVMHGSDNRPPGGEVIITDDVGFQEFMDHLLQRITNV